MPCVTWPAALAGPPGALRPALHEGGQNQGERCAPCPARRPGRRPAQRSGGARLGPGGRYLNGSRFGHECEL